MSPMIPQHESGSQRGVAQSGVAAGTIVINDEANQKQDVATLKRETSNTNTTVGKNPDLANVLGKQADIMAAAQAAGEAVAKTVGDIAGSKERAALAKAKEASDAGNQALAQQYRDEAAQWEEGGANRAALHAAGGALIVGLGGGNAVAGAAGAGAASLAGKTLNELSQTIASSVGSGNADLNDAIGNLVSNVAAGGIGLAVGGGSGAATAANVDRFNRQLHPDEKMLAQKMAAKSNGKYTAEQIEAQMRLSNVVDMNGTVLEYGTPDQIDAVTTKPTDTGVQWTSITGTTQIREIQAQPDAGFIAYIQAQRRTMQGDVPYTSRMDFSNVPKVSYSPGLLSTAKCGGGQTDCAAGLPTPYSAEEVARRRVQVADAASNFGTQTGRLGAAAGAIAASSPNPVVSTTAGTISFVSTVASVIAGGVEQLARPDVGQYLGEGALGATGYFLGERYPMAGPVINEFGEGIKATGAMDNIKAWINKGWNRTTTSEK
ncbi:hemolysin [Cupriavidus metallidurans]|uniref:hemolysin n=1 Tax=Cupriavidus TaxID=106589 RepID=UPI0025A74048|nr:hemolysin [Cupriavidus sp. TKC]GMG92285.1 hypothetical protein Cmtc_35050 [Cupriavidus sp. TKC]